MAESRRVHLTTPARHVPPSSFTSDAREADPQPARAAGADTVRLHLTLFEPDEQSFPEFSYSQLVDGKVGLGLYLTWGKKKNSLQLKAPGTVILPFLVSD